VLERRAGLKAAMIALIVLFFSSSASLAESLLYYPEKKCDTASESDLAFVAGFSSAWTIWGAFEYGRMDRLSKKSLLSDKDVRHLKKMKWRSQLFGIVQGVIGVLSIVEANDRCERKNRGIWYGISGLNLLGATFWISAGGKAGRVLSRHDIP